MADYFFDTSTLVKRHLNETGSPWVKSPVRAKAGHRVYIARITAVEVTSAITRRQYAGDLSAAQAGAILGHFRRHLTQYYRVMELTPALFAEAMLAASKHRLRAYDAAQLAVVLEVHRLQRDAGLGPVTAGFGRPGPRHCRGCRRSRRRRSHHASMRDEPLETSSRRAPAKPLAEMAIKAEEIMAATPSR